MGCDVESFANLGQVQNEALRALTATFCSASEATQSRNSRFGNENVAVQSVV